MKKGFSILDYHHQSIEDSMVTYTDMYVATSYVHGIHILQDLEIELEIIGPHAVCCPIP